MAPDPYDEPDQGSGLLPPDGVAWPPLPVSAAAEAPVAEVLVIAGAMQPMQPSMIAERVADRLPNGRYLQRDDLDHFGPMTHPGEIADIVATDLAR